MFIKRVIPVVLALLLCGVAVHADAWNESLTDNNGQKTLIVHDLVDPTQPTVIYGDPATHAMLTMTATSTMFFGTPEWDNAAVTGSSGTSLNPAATSYGFCFQNATASSVFLKLGSDAGSWDGFRVEAGGSRCIFGIKYSTFSVWTPLVATMSVEHWRY